MSKLAARFGYIGLALPGDQTHDDSSEGAEHLRRVDHAQLRVIFTKGHVPPIMQAILDQPLTAHQLQESVR